MKKSLVGKLKNVLLILAVAMWLPAVGGIVYPLVKAILIYQNAVTEQQAFNELAVPLIQKGFLVAGLASVLGLTFYRLAMKADHDT